MTNICFVIKAVVSVWTLQLQFMVMQVRDLSVCVRVCIKAVKTSPWQTFGQVVKMFFKMAVLHGRASSLILISGS